jgi:hypothetical protein
VQVRAGEPTGPQPELPKQRVDHPSGGRLAVGAGDVDHRDGVLGRPEQIEQITDAVERGGEVVLGSALEDRLLDVRDLGVRHGRRV